VKSGNLRRAVELLLDSYQEELFNYCARLVGLEQAALLHQHTLVTAFDNVQALEDAPSARAWLFRIARGLILQHQRRDLHEFPAAREATYVPVAGPADAPAPRLGEGGAAALARLDPQVLEVLQLSLWHGLQLTEVSHVLDRAVAEVRRLASHGLGALAMEVPDPSAAPS